MEEGGVETPLLSSEAKHANHQKETGSIRRRNSVSHLKCDFISNLPDKVRAGLDPESPFNLDLSKTKGFVQGISSSALMNFPPFCF